ncbi:hypothetical protein [Thiococcus pfennigii]|uniref:hypothetical protein n=1 Tax=Thiococcus pfennigii TaxID=1057 RepID=UPI00190461E3|nr:hypothetical protein [Thiococcus pfennigii]
MNIEASSSEELLNLLRGLDISVPSRTDGRKTEHTERYTICHLLSTLASSNRLQYPLTVQHSDRPDFVLSLAGKSIGIEHTEAVPENEAAKQALREKGIGPKVHFVSPTSPGEKRRSSKQLRAEIEADEMGDGWAGEQAQKEWAQVVQHFIRQKEAKLQAQGFKRHDEDWLLIYESWPLPAIDVKAAATYFCKHQAEEGTTPVFQKVFVMSGKKIVEFCEGTCTLHDDNDIWS